LEGKRIAFGRSKVSFQRPKWEYLEQSSGSFGEEKSARKFAKRGSF
jgi:hypothetical protein